MGNNNSNSSRSKRRQPPDVANGSNGGNGSNANNGSNGLDSLITQYISISSSLRAQLHVTQLRIATRMRVPATTAEETAPEDATSATNVKKVAQATKAAHDAIAMVREHLEQVDKDLPAVHTHLTEMGFLNM